MPTLSIVIVKKNNIMVTVHFTSELQDKDKKATLQRNQVYNNRVQTSE
jgi:hypothetical protein